MGAPRTKQAQVVTTQAELDPSMAVEQIALFDVNGDPLDLSGAGFDVAAAVANVTTPNATDLTTAQDLANANKAAINALLASLRAAGILAP